MTKVNTKSLLIIVVILLIGITALWQIQRRASPAAAWFSDAWQYRKAINIGYTGATALTDFQVSVDIGTSALIAAGKMKSDCSDIRFTDQNGNLLNYWIEENNPGCNKTTDTKIWLKVPSVKTSGTNIYIYYGNSSATSFQDGKKVFLEFDDFNTNTINNWTIESNPTTTYSISGGTMSCVTVGGDYSSAVFGSDYTDGILNSRFRVNSSQTHGGFLFRGQSIAADNSYQWILRRGNSDNRIQRRTSTSQYYLLGGSGGTSLPSSFSIDTWFPVEMRVIGTSVATFFNNASAIGGTTNDNTYSSGKFGIECYDGTQFFDYIFVRKYAPSDPTKTLLDEERSLAPIAHWSFDEGVGTSVYDSTSNQNNGVFAVGDSAPTWQTEDQCVVGKCLKFDSNDYVSIGDFGESPMTLSLWIKPSTTNDDQRIISNIDNSKASSPAFSLRFQSNKIQIWGTSWKDITTSTIPINKWTHIVVIVNSSGQAIGFVNGKQEVTAATDTYNFYSLGIGSKFIFSGNTAGNYYNGFIDEPKIYAYARTAAQIKQDYRAGLAGMKTQKGSSVAMGGSSGGKSLSDGLVGYWKMDENTGTVVGDSSGVGNTGTFATGDATPSWSSGKYGVGVSFDGVNDYINFGNPNLSSLTNATISFWRKGPSTPANWLLFQGQSSVYYIMATSGGTGNFYHSNAGGNKTIYVDGKVVLAPPSDNNWHHYVISGVNLSSWTTFLLNNYSNWHFKGAIDEIRLYNRALSYDEVRQLAEYAPGPVAYYDFEEGVGTTLYDRSGNGNNGVWQGTLGTHYGVGKLGKAGQFNGSNNYVDINSSSSLNIEGPITLETWVKPSIGSGQQGIIGTYGHSTAYSLYLRHTDNADIGFWNNINGTTNYAMQGTMDYGKWTHLASVWDGSKINLYQNGTLIYSGIGSSASNARNFQGLYLGYTNSIASPRYLDGLIDEVKIYNYARTQKQILQDMGANVPVGASTKVSKPIAWYKFDEGYGTVANNSGSIGSTINGTFGPGTSAPTWVTGKSGKGLSFDGNDYVELLNIPALSNTFSVSQWVKANNFSQAFNPIICRDGNTDKNMCLRFDTTGNIEFRQYTGDEIRTTQSYPANTWLHIAAVSDNLSGKIYVNGILIQTGNFTNSFNDTGNFRIGRYSYSTGYNFNGLIDEVKIYNYALSEDEIKQDYNQGATAVIGKSNQTIGATTTSLDYCIPGDTSHCAPPIAEYNFEEGVGTTAYDKSGNGNHCYTSNSPLWVSGKTGGALQFNGSNQRCTKTGGVTIGQITAQAWVYRTSSTTNQGIIRQQNSFILSLKDDTIQLGGTSFLNTGITIPLNSWQHVAWTNNGNNNILFINGQEKWRNSGGTLPNNTNDLNVAYDNNNWWWGGKIDSVKIYNYARTPAQIAYDYNKGAPIAHWKMDECQGATVHNSAADPATAGLGSTGTIVIGAGGSQTAIGTCQSSGAWYNGRTGKINSAMSFDGTDDWINNGTVYTSNQSQFTISLWAKFNQTKQQVLIGKYLTTGNQRSILMYQEPAIGNRLTLLLSSDGSNSCEKKLDGIIPTTGKWYHIIAVYNGSDVIWYIDGKQETSSMRSGTVQSILYGGTANFYIGNSESFANKFNGLIDDVRIYNYALTAEQVKSVYNGGSINFR